MLNPFILSELHYAGGQSSGQAVPPLTIRAGSHRSQAAEAGGAVFSAVVTVLLLLVPDMQFTSATIDTKTVYVFPLNKIKFMCQSYNTMAKKNQLICIRFLSISC